MNTNSLNNRELLILLVLTLFSYQGDIASSISTMSKKMRLYIASENAHAKQTVCKLHTSSLSNFEY